MLTPETVLQALVAKTMDIDPGRPDPLVMQSRPQKVGRPRPHNWRLVKKDDGKVDVEMSWPAIRTGFGRDQRRVSRGALAEIAADAFIGMPQKYELALLVAIRIDADARKRIANMLWSVAERSKQRDRFWPRKISRRQCSCGHFLTDEYTLDLIELAIQQFENPALLNTEISRADWFGFTRQHWNRTMRKPFDLLSGNLWTWYHAGIGHIQNRISRRLYEPEGEVA